MSNPDAVRQQYRDFVFPSVIKYYAEPLVLERGAGARVADAEGREYLDFFAGILTTGLGHAHPRVNAAVTEQMARLGHTSSLYLNARTAELAQKIAQITPGALRKSFFSCSGTEADETAVLTARHFTGRTDVIALRHGYAGRSSLGMNLTGIGPWKIGPSQGGVVHALAPYCYRCPLKLKPETCGVACAQDLEDVIRTSTNGGPAALIAEPITGVSGFITPPKDYFKIAVDIVRRHGGVFICDEVQSGWGRTGTHWFTIEHYGVEPEILTTAKAVANGFPLGVTVATDEVAAGLKGLHISTFGGSPVQAAAALAVIAEMEEQKLRERAHTLGLVLGAALDRLCARYAHVDDSRGMGLMRAVEIVKDKRTREPDPALCNQIFEAARERGLLIGKAGLYGNCFRIAPPLTIPEIELENGIERLEAAFAAVLG
jgi:alanine-glyoxylate transaminase / (R)-3-amino-2-methylpropionate-pyruvate transaminase